MANAHVFMPMGASNHTKEERAENDYYATDPRAAVDLLKIEHFNRNILEPCCGEGHLSKAILGEGYDCTSSDLIDRGYGEIKDFYSYDYWNGDIITNPPYKEARQFAEHALLNVLRPDAKVALFLKLTFLEGRTRHKFFMRHPPSVVYVSSRRIICAKNGDFATRRQLGSAVAYGWYVWRVGFAGEPAIRWFNP